MARHRLFDARHDEKVRVYCHVSGGRLCHIFKMRLWITPPPDITYIPALFVDNARPAL